MYEVTFLNYDGTFLYSTQVEIGNNVTYVGDTPIRNDDDYLEWIFTGWDKDLTNIVRDTVFTAQFYAPNAVECIFKNYDGTVLSVQYVANGDTVVYHGENPTRESINNDGTITKYEFIGWDKSLKNINSDCEFVALYGTNTYYEITFVDYDDTILKTDVVVLGGTATCKNPTRELDVNGNNITKYTFKGWDGSLTSIVAPAVLKAEYTFETFVGYKVTFLDGDGRELYSDYFKEGSAVKYPLTNPTNKYGVENVELFVGWDKSIIDLSCNTVVTAQYKTITYEQNGEYPSSLVTDATIISSLNRLSTTNSRGYYEYDGGQYAKVYSYNSSTTEWYKVEPIEWIFLDSDEDNFRFISKYCLEYAGQAEVNSFLDMFVKTAFLDDSLLQINSITNTGAETKFKKAYILSVDELRTLISNGVEIGSNIPTGYSATAYTKLAISISGSTAPYPPAFSWTRTSGYILQSDGIRRYGSYDGVLYRNLAGIRPIVTLKFDN